VNVRVERRGLRRDDGDFVVLCFSKPEAPSASVASYSELTARLGQWPAGARLLGRLAARSKNKRGDPKAAP
jgi:hypothetical protein